VALLFCDLQEDIHCVGSTWERQLFVINWCTCCMFFLFERLTLSSFFSLSFFVCSVVSLSFQELQPIN